MAGGPFGFSLSGSCFGIFFVVWIFSLMFTMWFLVCFIRKSNRFLVMLPVAAGAAMLACLLSEIVILADELRFVNQITGEIAPESEKETAYFTQFCKPADMQSNPWCCRPRQWPLGGTLHYSPGRGFWSLD